MPATPSRDELAAEYLDLLPFEPYPVQEEALLAWFMTDQGVLVCAPTGTGKTLIAEATLFEALKTGKRAYYTTPLIALTEQKLQELRQACVRWGYPPESVGLVTGNRRVNADAPLLVVVAEILFNRLLHHEFNFDNVAGVVMDEFHSFNDPERGIVWEFSLGLLPKDVRLMLLSATVGNAMEFIHWMRQTNQRKLELVQSDERKIPLSFRWVGDQLLNDFVEEIAQGDEASRYTPALVFCFNRDECWNVAEQLKGKRLLADGQQKQLSDELAKHDWSGGAGPKLRAILQRGVGVHHAGLLPRYKRIVESLFQRKLLSVTVCTETLAAGINLPARSVLLPQLMKGPPGNKKLIDPSSAHQMFGRAGRPQYDTQGYVFAIAHEDDVKILRWKEKYDQIPEDTKDPQLIRAKKALKKKMPTRRAGEAYWNESQFESLRVAPAGKLQSRGPLPWRLLAYMLTASPEVEPIRELVSKRLMGPKQLEAAQRTLDRMLLTLWTAGYVTLDPRPPLDASVTAKNAAKETASEPAAEAVAPSLFGSVLPAPPTPNPPSAASKPNSVSANTYSVSANATAADGPSSYRAKTATPTPQMERLLQLRGVNPLYGVFVVNQLGIADFRERLQAFESILEMPGSVARHVRVPKREEMPPGPLATTRLDVQLLQLGLATPEELGAQAEEEDEDDRFRGTFAEEKVWPLVFAEKLKRLFDHDFPGVGDVQITPVWAAGEILEYGGNFEKFVSSKRLQKQEGILFRHLLRLILLVGEFLPLCPPDADPDAWREELSGLREKLISTCREVDPSSVEEVLSQAEDDVP
jgi:superfamily II DNA/RNA helicase